MVCENLPLKALHPAARRGRQRQKMLLEGYNILGPDRSGDIPHSQGRVTAKRANNNYWGDVSVCKIETHRKAWRARSLVFCESTHPWLCFSAPHRTAGNPQLGQAGRSLPAFVQPCPLAPASQDQKHLLLCKVSPFIPLQQTESKFSPGIYGQQRI